MNKVTTISNENNYCSLFHFAIFKMISIQINTAANSVYWSLGKVLFEKQLQEGFGSGIEKYYSCKSSFAPILKKIGL